MHEDREKNTQFIFLIKHIIHGIFAYLFLIYSSLVCMCHINEMKKELLTHATLHDVSRAIFQSLHPAAH